MEAFLPLSRPCSSAVHLRVAIAEGEEGLMAHPEHGRAFPRSGLDLPETANRLQRLGVGR